MFSKISFTILLVKNNNDSIEELLINGGVIQNGGYW
jgi:hypothetical protein